MRLVNLARCALATTLSLSASTGCKHAPATPELTAEDCHALHERMLQVAVKESTRKELQLSDSDRSALEIQLRKDLELDPAARHLTDDCERDLTKLQFDCMMQTSDLNAMEDCERAKP